jgi:hypothetical protein
VPAGTTFYEFGVPISNPEFLRPHRVVSVASLRVNRQVCDLTFCHDHSSEQMPSCLAATIIHGLEGLTEHEVGEVDVAKMDGWLQLATKHGFDLSLPEGRAGRSEGLVFSNPQEAAAMPIRLAEDQEVALRKWPDAKAALPADPDAAKRAAGDRWRTEDEPPAKRLRARHVAMVASQTALSARAA